MNAVIQMCEELNSLNFSHVYLHLLQSHHVWNETAYVHEVKPVPRLYSCLNQGQNFQFLPYVKWFQCPILFLRRTWGFFPLISEGIESNASVLNCLEIIYTKDIVWLKAITGTKPVIFGQNLSGWRRQQLSLLANEKRIPWARLQNLLLYMQLLLRVRG